MSPMRWIGLECGKLQSGVCVLCLLVCLVVTKVYIDMSAGHEMMFYGFPYMPTFSTMMGGRVSNVVEEKLRTGDKIKVVVLVSGFPRVVDVLVENHAWAFGSENTADRYQVDVIYALSSGKDNQNELGENFSIQKSRIDKWSKLLGNYGIRIVDTKVFPDTKFTEQIIISKDEMKAHVHKQNALRYIETNERSDTKHVAYQFQSLYTGYQFIEKYEHDNNLRYDVVIRVRSDALLLSPVNITDLYTQLGSQGSGRPRVFVPNYGDYGGIHDRFAIMDRASAVSYMVHRYTYWKREKSFDIHRSWEFLNLPNGEMYLRVALAVDGVSVIKAPSLDVHVAPHGCLSYPNECAHDGEKYEHPQAVNLCRRLACTVLPFDSLNSAWLTRIKCNYYNNNLSGC